MANWPIERPMTVGTLRHPETVPGTNRKKTAINGTSHSLPVMVARYGQTSDKHGMAILIPTVPSPKIQKALCIAALRASTLSIRAALVIGGGAGRARLRRLSFIFWGWFTGHFPRMILNHLFFAEL